MSLPRTLAVCAVVALTGTAIIPGVASAQKRGGTHARVRRSVASGSVIRT